MIVQLGKYFRPVRGGIESVTEDLRDWCVQRKMATKLICFSPVGHSGDNFEQSLASSSVIRCSYFSVKSQPISLRYLLMSLYWGIRAESVLVHCPNFLGQIAAICIKVARPSVKLIGFWHSDVVGKGWLYHFLIPIERLFLLTCTDVICTSPNYGASSDALRAVSHKISVVPLTVNDTFLTSEAKPPVGREAAEVGRPYLLSCGRNVGYKNYRGLIETFLGSGSVLDLVICGSNLAELREFALLCGDFSQKIVFLESVPECEKRWLFENASALILPSTTKDEAFGVVLIEALAVGTPIVSFDIPGSGVGWVNDGKAGVLLDNEDWTGLADVCRDGQEIRSQFRKTAVQQEYVQRFSRASMFKRLDVLFGMERCIE